MSVCYSNCCGLVAQLRADLATVTAENEVLRKGIVSTRDEVNEVKDRWADERLAHAETRKALEVMHAMLATANKSAEHWHDMNESTRTELAKAEARVKELEQQNARLVRLMVHNGLHFVTNEAC